MYMPDASFQKVMDILCGSQNPMTSSLSNTRISELALVTSDGTFDYLFNICRWSADLPIILSTSAGLQMNLNM
jgi:hypothetical protein